MESHLRREVLGKVFVCRHSYRAPEVVQVIGWTKNSEKDTAKVRYVYVRDVDLHVHHNNQYGGEATVVRETIAQVDEPILKPGHTRMTLSLPKGEGDTITALSSGIDMFYLYDTTLPHEEPFRWCQY